MVKRIIACGDIHFKQLKGIDELKDALSVFIEKSRRIVEEYGSDSVRIAVLGDIFQKKIEVSNESILAVNWFFTELDKLCKTVVIAGNHDFLMNNMDRVDSITPLFEVGNFKNVRYLDMELGYKSGVVLDDNVAWCLYSSFDGFNRPDFERVTEMNGGNFVKVGLIHADINGAKTPTNFVTENGIDLGVFEGLDFCLAGHIHMFQELKKNGVKVVYCSSITQKDRGETVTGHGFLVWDIEDPDYPTYEFVEVEDPDNGFYNFEITSPEDIKNDLEVLTNL